MLPAVGAYLAGLIAAALGAPAYIYLIVGLLAGLIVSVLVLAFRPPLHLRQQQGPKAEKQSASGAVGVVGVPTWVALPPWMQEVMDGDRASLADRIIVTRFSPDATALGVPEPYLDFDFGLFNGSVFTIFLTGEVRGRIRCYSNPLANMPEIVNPRVTDHSAGGPKYPHGQDFNLRLRQFISAEVRQQLVDGKGQPVTFSFDELTVPFGARDDSSGQRPALHLGTYTIRLD